jgi:glucokinase
MPQNNEHLKVVVGVEVGGSKIRTGLCREGLKITRPLKLSTKSERGAAAVVGRIARAVRDAVDEADLALDDVRAVGVGVPGIVDADTGSVICAPSLRWDDVPLRQQLEKELGLPVFMENVGNLATLAAYMVELKSKPATVQGIFVGTGINGGLVYQGEIYRGVNRSAGEVGHMVVAVGGAKCCCGNKGCLDALAGRNALNERIREAIKNGEPTVLTDLLDGDMKRIRTSDLRKALRAGDPLVEACVKESARFLGIAVGNIVNLIHPEVIVLGGDMMEAVSDKMFPIIQETARKYAMPGSFDECRLQLSVLGDNAGVIGAVILARQMTA